MILRMVKWGVIGLGAAAVVGGIVFGTDLVSYVSTSTRSVRTAMKDAVPIDFELQRARNLLEDIIPEMQANVRLIAQEEVEVADLGADIQRAQASLAEERARVARLRSTLNTENVSYVLGGVRYTRGQIKDELARRFDHVKEAEVVLAGKQRLLEARQKSLHAAMQMLDRARTQKAALQDQVATLESQYRLVQAASSGSRFELNNTKLAQTQKLLGEIRKRLDVAERVLAHEARFTLPIEVDVVSEKDLVTQVDEFLAQGGSGPTTAPAEAMEVPTALSAR